MSYNKPSSLLPVLLYTYIIILKMWNSRNSFILICICYISCVLAENCDPVYKLPKWEPPQSKPPGYLRQGQPPEWNLALEALVENRTEDFNLNLYANPFIKNGSCPSADSCYQDLRRFHIPRPVYKDGNEGESIFFGNIFTGCYYFEMENAAGKKWLWDPKFYETSYHYHDTMLKCISSKFKPESDNRSSQLLLELKIPLTCLQARYKLFESNKTIEKPESDHSAFGNISATQDCWVINNGIGNLPLLRCNNLKTAVILHSAHAVEVNGDEGWSIKTTWDNLTKGSYYYSFIQLYNHTCNMSYGDLMTWRPVTSISVISHEEYGPS